MDVPTKNINDILKLVSKANELSEVKNIAKEIVEIPKNKKGLIPGKLGVLGYKIDSKNYTESFMNSIRADLNVYTTKDLEKIREGKMTGPPIRMYYKKGDNYYIPHVYARRKIGAPWINTLEKYCIETPCKFNKKEYPLFDRQKEILNSVLPILDSKGYGILSAGCAAGKTSMVIYIKCKLKKACLIVLPRIDVMNQWIEEINKFTANPKATYGILKGEKSWEVIDCNMPDFVLTTMQSFSKHKWPIEFLRKFGIIAYDECQHMYSREYSEVFMKCTARYMIGISATSLRVDRLDIIGELFLGKSMYNDSFQHKNQIIVEVITFSKNLVGDVKDILNPEIIMTKSKQREKVIPIDRKMAQIKRNMEQKLKEIEFKNEQKRLKNIREGRDPNWRIKYQTLDEMIEKKLAADEKKKKTKEELDDSGEMSDETKNALTNILHNTVNSKSNKIANVRATAEQVASYSYGKIHKTNRNTVDPTKILYDVVRNPIRNKKIIEWVSAMAAGHDSRIFNSNTIAPVRHKILVISSRIEHLYVMEYMLNQLNPDISTGVIRGQMTLDETEIQKTKQVIFGYIGCVKDAFSVADIDCMVIATSIKNVVVDDGDGAKSEILQQVFGRPTRKSHNHPVQILYVADDYGHMKSHKTAFLEYCSRNPNVTTYEIDIWGESVPFPLYNAEKHNITQPKHNLIGSLVQKNDELEIDYNSDSEEKSWC